MGDMIGVLGGMGPRATVNFIQEVVNKTVAEKDWDHVHMLVDFAINIPSRGRHIMLDEESPVGGMREACFKLMNAGCTKIFVPCNSAHYFYDEVVESTSIPWVNMLQLAADKVKDYNKVLILGAHTTILKRSYDKYLNNTYYIGDNDPVFKLIEKIKTGAVCGEEVTEVCNKIVDINADCVLLACTELPIIFSGAVFNNADVVDAGDLYVKELIKCGGCDVIRG